MRRTGEELLGHTPTPSRIEQLQQALWRLRLRSANGLGCWCYKDNTENFYKLDFNHDHRCRAARAAML